MYSRVASMETEKRIILEHEISDLRKVLVETNRHLKEVLEENLKLRAALQLANRVLGDRSEVVSSQEWMA